MFTLMSAYEQSSLSRQSFCEAHSVKLSTFNYWRTKYLSSKQAEPSGFVSLVPEAVSASGLELHYGKVMIRLESGVSVDFVVSLVEKLSV